MSQRIYIHGIFLCFIRSLQNRKKAEPQHQLRTKSSSTFRIKMGKCLQIAFIVVGAISCAGIGAGIAVLCLGVAQESSSPSEDIYAECALVQNPGEVGDTRGTITFHQMKGSNIVHIEGNVTGLNTGLHGFHIHTYGVVGGDCGSASGHYNPDDFVHAGPDAAQRHVGDLGNIESVGDGTPTGTAYVNIDDEVVSLYGERSIVGRSVVVHAKEDDLGLGGDEGSLTTGNAGARLACCTIFLAPQYLEN
ncbi:superoxide dismutase [Cu-Zn]-like [Palaemon carinicauda]|uniref:superoxide dismutase [Cu-Zn]-like n=1 Tax=Palaemon carinicauda TaxID=392227 RepID=UPI0035B5F20C